jgi:predicted RNA binding protein YcfA (HicA-like mRNA interferase family)
MRLPRDVSGDDLVRALQGLGFTVIRQTGSHIRMATQIHHQYRVTIPKHSPLRIGTLSGILNDIAAYLGVNRDELAERLFK